MAYVITEPCIGVKDSACVTVCPADCIHPTPMEATAFAAAPQLFIDPGHCIDCDLCAHECPVAAIFPQSEVPAQWQHFIEKNAQHFAKPAE